MLSRWVSGLLLQLHSNPCVLEDGFGGADDSRLLVGLRLPTAPAHGLTDGFGARATVEGKVLLINGGLNIDWLGDAYKAEQPFEITAGRSAGSDPDPQITHFNTDINGQKQRGHTHPPGHFP